MNRLDDVISRLDEFVRQKMELDAIPGLAMAVTDKSENIHVVTYGSSDPCTGVGVSRETLFQIGSISKSFTSIALLQLQEQGKVDLQEPVTEYIPWFKVRSEHAPITLHHLMTHTAGIPIGSEATMAPESEVWVLRNLETSTPPGARFHYSNTGYKALGLVLESVTGAPYAEVIRTQILEPLGMMDTEPVITPALRPRSATGHTWLRDDRPPPRNGTLVPAPWSDSNTGDGSISSTPEDMAKYLRMLLNRGVGPEGRLISEGSYGLLTDRYVFCGEDGREEHYGYGLCVEAFEERVILAHTGGMVGYTSSMLADTGLGLGIIVLTNSVDEPEEVSRFFLQLVGADSRGANLPEVVLPVQRRVPKAPSDYVGDYLGAGGSMTIREEGGMLRAVIGGVETPMVCVREDFFHLDHPDYSLFLVGFRRHDGKVVAAFHGGDEYHASEARLQKPSRRMPERFEAFEGHYRSHNPWLSNFRVVRRGDGLILIEPSGMEHALVPTGEESFRVDEDPGSPETISFGMVVEGRAIMACLSGGPYYRTFTP